MVIYMVYFEAKISIHLTWKVQIALFFAEKGTIPNEYSDYTNIFTKKLAVGLPKRFNIIKYIIDLEPSKQLLYGPIYSLCWIELKILKTYIKTNLANNFIQLFKLLAGAPILFVKKLDGSFQLCINYCSLNNLIIKKKYLLLLIIMTFNQLDQA